MAIRLILDTSAISEYVKGSIHVGELLAELHDEAQEVRFAVPVTCLAEAGLATESTESLRLLASHQRATVIPVAADRWPDLVNLTKMMGQRAACRALLGRHSPRGLLPPHGNAAALSKHRSCH